MILIKNILFNFCILFFYADYAYAYFDPGLGSMILQGILVFITSCLVFFRSAVINLKNKIKIFFKKIKKN